MKLAKYAWLATTLFAGALSPALAFAQTAAPAQDQTRKDDAKPDQGTAVKEVVVTGSRFKRTEYNSAAPIQVLSADTARMQGATTTTDLLMTSTLIQGAFQVNNELTGFVNTGGPGVNTASLRGLGPQRTLILIDGQRIGPAGVRGTVGPIDLNTIPFGIVDQVQILKDGASSVYGSDAVAGVINIITKKDLNGGVLNVSTKQTQAGGGATYHLDGAWGKIFSKGFFNVAINYDDQETLTKGQRPQTACGADYYDNAAGTARVDFAGLNGATKCYNLFADAINTSGTRNFGTVIYAQPGVTYPTALQGNSGGALGNQPLPAGLARELRAGFPGTYPYALEEFPAYVNRASVISPDKTYAVKLRGGYDLTSDTQVTADLLLNRRESEQYSYRQFFPNFSTANPNNPFGTSIGTGLLPIVPMKSDSDQEVNYLNFRAGIKGKIHDVPVIDGWSWDAYVGESYSYGRYGNDIILNDRVNAVTGSKACNPAAITISAGQAGGSCSTIPGGIPLLNPAELSGQFTPAEAAFLFQHENSKTTYEQHDFEATMSGDLFSLPAGKLGLALGVDVRGMSIDDIPGLNQRTANLWGQSAAGETKGSDMVKEVFTEIDAPLVKDVPLIKSLDLTASGRYTDYDSYGGSSTYRLGLNWGVTDWLILRGTHGTSFRAPALYELYLANQTSFANQLGLDPCINWGASPNTTLQKNCAARGVDPAYNGGGTSSATVTTGGGKGLLKAETSQATVLGLVFQPKTDPVKLAVDFTNMEIDNEVAQLGTANIANLCMMSTNFPNDPYCKLLTFGPATPNGVNQILTVNNSYRNLATQKLRSLDVTLDAWHNIGENKFALRLTGSWELRMTRQLFAGSPTLDYTSTTYNYNGPQFNGVATFSWRRGDWFAMWTVDMIGHGSDQNFLGSSAPSTRYSTSCYFPGTAVSGSCASLIAMTPPTVKGKPATLTAVGVPVTLKNYTEATIFHTLSLQKKFDTFTVTGAVRNVFDEKAPSVSSGEFRNGTAALNGYTDGYLGRQFYIGVSKKF